MPATTSAAASENAADAKPSSPASGLQGGAYRLGPEDSLSIHVKDEPEIPDGPYQVDLNGDLRLPELGVVHAGGSTVSELTEKLTAGCRRLLKDPVVTVGVTEYRSQRVSVLGAVNTPGVQQIRGRKTLYEVISEAGGLRTGAGGTIQVSRKVQEGPLPLAGAQLDSTGEFEIASVDVDALMRARSPQANIAVRPNDVITVPKAELVYVLGAVRKPGGFELTEKKTISVMQALSLAEGAERTAATRHARILRQVEDTGPRAEIPVDLNQLIAGKQGDIMLRPNDILVVPNSAAKSASYRALEVLVNTGSGVAIYRPY